MAVYSASKFYVRGLTEALNIEWKEHGIHVCSVKPPYVQTAMLEDVPPEAMERVTAEFTPEQIAEEIFLAAHGRRIGRVIGFKIKAWNLLARLFPETLGKVITRLIAGY